MQFEIREHEVVMTPETDHDRDVLRRLRGGIQGVSDNITTSREWSAKSSELGLVFKLRDPDNWGR